MLGGDFHTALSRCLWVEAITMIGLLVLSPLMPRHARESAGEAEEPAELDPI
jgi:hypothetical protein